MHLKIERMSVVLLVLPLLSGGQCAFVASSGNHNSKDEPRNGLVVVIRNGRLVDGPVEGVRFEAGSLSGFTGPDGEFQFEDGGRIQFFIGDIALGDAVPAKALMTPLDLVPGGDTNTPAVINIARLLQSLDAVPGDARITITAGMRRLARRSNDETGAAIAFIDFSDDARFANSASQLVASLGNGLSIGGVLVDADTARRHLRASLAALVTVPRRQKTGAPDRDH